MDNLETKCLAKYLHQFCISDRVIICIHLPFMYSSYLIIVFISSRLFRGPHSWEVSMKRLLICVICVSFLILLSCNLHVQAVSEHNHQTHIIVSETQKIMNSFNIENTAFTLTNGIGSNQIWEIIAILASCVLSVVIMLFVMSKLKQPKRSHHNAIHNGMNHINSTSAFPLSTEDKMCLFCNTLNKPNEQVCEKCGKKLEE